MPHTRRFVFLALAAGIAALAAAFTVRGKPATSATTQTGRIEVRQVDGPSLAGNALEVPATRRVSVYLPPSYDTSPRRAYPTLYVLHGIFDSDTTWTSPWSSSPPGYDTIQALMNRGVAAGALEEMIIVIPDSEKTCHYTNSPLKGNWEDFIRRDLVAFIDGEYRTLARPASRGIAGHSMGGHGAIKLGMKYPDTFSAVYGLNPSLLGWGGDLSVDNPALAGLATLESLADLGSAHFYVQALAGVGHCFSPSPSDPPFLTDFPFEVVDGQVVRAAPGAERWEAQMPLYMIDTYAENLSRLRGLRFDTALVEEFSHIPLTSKAFSDALTQRGIAHQFEMYNGDHRNRLWGAQGRLYTELLPYFSSLLETDGEGRGAGYDRYLESSASRRSMQESSSSRLSGFGKNSATPDRKALATSSSVATPDIAQTTGTWQASTDAELKKLFEQDQSDRLSRTVSGSDLSERDLARRQRMMELLVVGRVTTPDDLYHAAFLLQHTNPAHPDYTPELYLLAHALAEAAAFEGHEEARWLSAATLDRYLQFTGDKQFFGTQQQQDGTGEWQRGTPHGYLTDEVLARFGLAGR